MDGVSISVEPRFIVDRMFGTLVRWLRMLGYDALYAGDIVIEDYEAEDDVLLKIALEDFRILITRDKALHSKAERIDLPALYLVDLDVNGQLAAVAKNFKIRFNIHAVRCTLCNHLLSELDVDSDPHLIADNDYVPQDVLDGSIDGWICEHCGQIYWAGSHWDNIKARLRSISDGTW